MNEHQLITVIGRGHSGTRAISHTLSQSGVFMGAELNASGDLVPADDLYEACRVMARHVRHLGAARWDFSAVHTGPIDPAFKRLIHSYLDSVLGSDAPLRGWKLPETTLVYPWIVRLFPDAYFIHWYRDPRDCILGPHLTDDLEKFGVPVPGDGSADPMVRRAISWKYQSEIIRSTPPPDKNIQVRFEDFVLNQGETLKRLERFLGLDLEKIEVKPEAVGRWTREKDFPSLPLLEQEIRQFGFPRDERSN